MRKLTHLLKRQLAKNIVWVPFGANRSCLGDCHSRYTFICCGNDYAAALVLELSRSFLPK